ncbi:MAG: MBOAT family protein [Flavobacteriales bacterium]|nr:MBOAT family protein [Flavobacteriales bacterium]MBK6549522.1 MBOAT family protein [Flavobacteriales bacterium]MBK6883890.1 MBOAT family protein [Flavobacteriales bacterium]MBK7100282.1 MBOAT family protein [Flavobacteriales bacterium]MBK7110975.1 MBOAT family protein [Flavobacteriales bacterium]
MLFLSSEFIVFFAVVFVLYWAMERVSATAQNLVLLAGGLFFYGWADLRFLALLTLSAATNYGLGLAIEDTKSEPRRRVWFWFGMVFNFGLLAYFKYFGFFYDSFVDLLNQFGGHSEHLSLKIALPLGISFFTFQVAGYLIDVFNGGIEVCRKPVHFFTYVFHFPKLLSGPVERAQAFLPRLTLVRAFDRALVTDGARQILWGIFAKAVIADNLAPLVDRVHADIPGSGGSTLLLAAPLYLIQLFADFSGYSNMAIGTSKMLGIPLAINFRGPLFVANISEFWRKWHISLTSWMMDYVFTPISFLLRDKGRVGMVIAIFITFLAVGIWHGANWTFMAFGLVQGVYFLPLVLSGKVNVTSRKDRWWQQVPAMLGMFVLMSLTFVLMRATDLSAAWMYMQGIPNASLFETPDIDIWTIFIPLFVFVGMEWYTRGMDHALQTWATERHWFFRWTSYGLLITLILLSMSTQEAGFIYFQF